MVKILGEDRVKHMESFQNGFEMTTAFPRQALRDDVPDLERRMFRRIPAVHPYSSIAAGRSSKELRKSEARYVTQRNPCVGWYEILSLQGIRI